MKQPLIVLPFTALFLLSCNDEQEQRDASTGASAPLSGDFVFIEKIADKRTTKSIDSFSVEVRVPGQRKQVSSIRGTLEAVYFHEGQTFKKGDLLFQANNSSAFDAYMSEREAFLALLVKVETNGSENDRKILSAFRSGIDPSDLLPPFPEQPLGDANIFSQLKESYEKLKRSERHIRNHFVIAENDGTVVAVLKRPGETVAANEPVLLTGSSEKRFVNIPFSAKLQKKLILKGPDGRPAGEYSSAAVKNGKLEVSPNARPGKGYSILAE